MKVDKQLEQRNLAWSFGVTSARGWILYGKCRATDADKKRLLDQYHAWPRFGEVMRRDEWWRFVTTEKFDVDFGALFGKDKGEHMVKDRDFLFGFIAGAICTWLDIPVPTSFA